MRGNRRNVRNIGRFSGSNVRQSGISRRRFLGTAAAGVGAVALEASGVARATDGVREISDWALNNPRVFYAYFGFDPNEVFNYGRYSYWPFLRLSFRKDETPPEYYDGSITEVDLPDGRVEVTVQLHGIDFPIKECGFLRTDYNEIVNIFEDGGTMQSLYAEYRFILDYPGQEIPFLFALDKTYSHVVGTGEGTFADNAADFGYTPGTRGKVHINQVELPLAQPSIPNKNDYYMPVEMINIIQL